MEHLTKAIQFVRVHRVEAAAILLLVVLCTLSAAMAGNAAHNLQSVLMTYYRLIQLLIWALVCCWINDQLYGEKYDDNREQIEANPSRANRRTAVLCVLIFAGAMLLKPL